MICSPFSVALAHPLPPLASNDSFAALPPIVQFTGDELLRINGPIEKNTNAVNDVFIARHNFIRLQSRVNGRYVLFPAINVGREIFD